MAVAAQADGNTALVNALNDDITRAVLGQSLATMEAAGWGEPPVPFAVLVMGSAGRAESLLHPDQDNGFILADHPQSEVEPSRTVHDVGDDERKEHAEDSRADPVEDLHGNDEVGIC